MRRGIFSHILIVLVVAILGTGAYTFFKDMDGPSVRVTPDNGSVSPNTKIQVGMDDPSGIRELSVGIRRNNAVTVFFHKTYEDAPEAAIEEVSLAGANLPAGSFELEVKATDDSLAGFGMGNKRTIYLPMKLDTQPPRISVKTLPPSIRRGGSAAIRYTVDEEVSSTGVLISGYFVTAYRQKDGSYVCIYPFPYTMSAQDFRRGLELVATDLAGNVTRNHIAASVGERTFRNDRITVTDSFLLKVQNKLGHLAPGIADPLQCYLTVNANVRAQNMEALRSLSKQSTGTMLWSDGFRAIPRAAVRANFGDHRTLVHNGTIVGEATHLGLDLASLRQAAIPAANSGKVIYTGEMGIYGNMVLIDHGLGVLTLYSHMTDIGVNAGDLVSRGQIIGHTGETGLAFGDHLHFGVVVGGLEVTPIEWLDPKWVANIVKSITGTR